MLSPMEVDRVRAERSDREIMTECDNCGEKGRCSRDSCLSRNSGKDKGKGKGRGGKEGKATRTRVTKGGNKENIQ